MRALFVAVLCSAVFAGTLYLGGQSVGAFDRPAAAAPSGAAKAKKRTNRAATRFNARDQRAARAGVLRRGDLGAGWKGGKKKLDLSSDAGCPNYRPRAWDLVVTGAAATEFTHPGGLRIGSDAKVMRTPRMVRLDWKRSIEHPNVLSCMRRVLARAIARSDGTIVSLRRRPFPKMAPYTAKFRFVGKVRDRSRRTVPFFTDLVLVWKGRHELMLIVGGPLHERAAANKAEVRLAKRLLARMRS